MQWDSFHTTIESREKSFLTRLIRWERHSVDGQCQKVGYFGNQLIFFSARRDGRQYVTRDGMGKLLLKI